jgi:hypothetical protein
MNTIPKGEAGSARGCALRKLFDMEMAETPVRLGCRGALIPNHLNSRTHRAGLGGNSR